MPVTYRIDKTSGTIYTKCIGNTTVVEVLEHFHELIRDVECPDRLNVLLDLSETTSIPETQQLRTVSDRIGIIRQRISFGDCVIVAGREVLYGMSRVFEAFAGKWFREIHVCRTTEEAEAWLAARSAAQREQSSGAG